MRAGAGGLAFARRPGWWSSEPGPGIGVGVPAAVAGLLAAAYLIASPPSGDLAGALYRADVFSRHGFVLWDGQWYAGHYTLGYSVLYGPLAALAGARAVGALSAVLAGVLFAALARRTAGPGALVGSVWFAAGAAAWLLTGRLTFELGLAFGLAAVLVAVGDRLVLSLALGVLTSLCSPVAGLFAALAAAALVLGGDHRRTGAVLGAAALAPLGVLALAFPEGGREPFGASSFWPALGALMLLGALAPGRLRTLRAGVVLYALLCTLAFVAPTPLGGNVVRLGALFAGPVAALALARERPRLLALLALPLLYWQLVAPVRDAGVGAGDPSTRATYYKPLLAFLHQTRGPFRIEIPFTREKWETYLVAQSVPLARGWERQLDASANSLFYEGTLTPARYRRWLADNGVRYVAVADVALDSSAVAEGRLIGRGLPFLRPAWSSRHWRVYAVVGARGLTVGPGALIELGVQSFGARADRAGTLIVAERYSPYWSILGGHGCVSRAPGGWTRLDAAAAGPMHVGIRFSLARVLARGRRCF